MAPPVISLLSSDEEEDVVKLVGVGKPKQEEEDDEVEVLDVPAAAAAAASKPKPDTPTLAKNGFDPFGPLQDGETTKVAGSGKSCYTIKRTGYTYYCSCPAWKFQNKNPGTGRTCKHIDKLRIGYGSNHVGHQQSPSKKKIPRAAALPNNNSNKKQKADHNSNNNNKTDDMIGVTLAEKWNPEKQDPKGYYMSEKLDGMRCVWDTKGLWSRNGNAISAPIWFLDCLPKTLCLDGELYFGRQTFQTLMSIKSNRLDPRWKTTKYVVFDAPKISGDFGTRLQAMTAALSNCQCPTSVCTVLEQTVCTGAAHVSSQLQKVLALGGEGVMLRHPDARYESGRAKSLLKVKQTLDAEATVVAHELGKGKHLGRLGALKCTMIPSGKLFKLGSGFADAQRDAPPPIGAIVTYKYQELTDDGVPRFPVFDRVKPQE